MEEQLNKSVSPASIPTEVFQPKIFDISKESDAHLFKNLKHTSSDIVVIDFLESQLEELIQLRNPRIKLSQEEIEKEIHEMTGGDSNKYGLWVHYPWLHRIVHILPEKEFIEVRTNRNQNKITPEERELLSKKIVGVVGLSVGKSIAIAMAMERSFGEIRVADFDTLDLSNINRLQTGISSIGLPKTVIAAREILEIDPFLKVTCFHDGLTEENMEDFFCKGGDLDLIVDECDGLDLKIRLREKARLMKIPVLMDMNDRGTLDVERFDLEPNRPLLHGLMDDLNADEIKNLSNIEKIPFILPC